MHKASPPNSFFLSFSVGSPTAATAAAAATAHSLLVHFLFYDPDVIGIHIGGHRRPVREGRMSDGWNLGERSGISNFFSLSLFLLGDRRKRRIVRDVNGR